jgi:hypothetical protein
MDNNLRVKTIIVRDGVKPVAMQAYSVSAESTLRLRIKSNPNPWMPVHDGSIKNEKDLAGWELTIPQYECGCRAFYAKYKADNHPDFSTPEAFFAWGVALHNAVNRKLGKPELTIDEALSIWRNGDGSTQDGSEIVP